MATSNFVIPGTQSTDAELTAAINAAKFTSVDGVTVKTLSSLSDEDTWTDIDITSVTNAAATSALINCFMVEGGLLCTFALHLRPNGSSQEKSADTARVKVQTGSLLGSNTAVVPLDAGQVFEYLLDREAGGGALEFGVISVLGYWV